ncbi:hypothetical protein I4U23_015531 [Adineta vaga]|nr:hypothetical protein I4U23_015531 [Adineta vaga]
MDLKEKSLVLLKHHQNVYEDFLIRLFKKSLEGLNVSLNEINRCRRYSWCYTSFHDIQNLKTNLIFIQEQYDSYIEKLSNEIKEYRKEISEENFNEATKHIDYLFDKTSEQLLLLTIYSAIGLMNSIDSILLLFTGIGTDVLGIAPIRMGFVINNTASEMMFKDKLNELEAKLTYIIRNIEIKKSQQLDHLNLYFNLSRKQISH